MARLHLHATEPEFNVERNPDGDVVLDVRAEGVSIRVHVGGNYDDVSLLAESLRHLADDVVENILDGWQDVPDEFDASITVDRGRYHVSLEGSRVGDYPSRDVAEIELARAMVTGGVFPNAWYVDERGYHVDINADIRRWHTIGGDAMAPLDAVQYKPGDRVWFVDTDWPYVVDGDWGPAGVEIHTDGDPSIRAHVTDRSELRTIED
jgi:hypothetical protein